MTIKVLIENIGGLEGKHVYEFAKGAINIVKAPNAAGKSTLIKAMTLCLSHPFKSDLLLKIARDMGLLRQPGENIEPLVHVGSNSASVVIKMTEKEWKISLTKDGISPSREEEHEGDERFIVTSVITRESRILRNLITGETNFKWLIENVSLAKKYDIIAATLEEEILKFGDLLNRINVRRKEVTKIMERIKDLSKVIDEIVKKEQMLNRELSELIARNPEIKALRERRDALLTRIKEVDANVSGIEEEISESQRALNEEARKYREKIDKRDELRAQLERKSKEIEQIKERIKELDEDLKMFEERLKELHEKEVELRIEEGKALALLELYQNALKVVSSNLGEKAQCFLCKQGYLTPSSLEQSKLLIENSLIEVRNKIASLLRERNRLYSYRNEREELERKIKNLKRELSEISGRLAGLERDLSTYEDKTKALKMKIEQYTKTLEDLKRERESYESEVTKIDEIIGMRGEEEKRLVSEISELRGKISLLREQRSREQKMFEELSRFEIDGIACSIEDAYNICSSWLEALKRVYEMVALEVKKERRAAVEIFNFYVKNVIKETGFDLDVWIDPRDYKLYIKDLKSNNDISPRILSESQRHILALVMHIALKLSYTPHIPFLLIDEVVLSFDERRRSAVMKYFLDLAKNNGWAVILTELGSEDGIVVQTIKDL